MNTIGLIGGMSWESTAHYYALLNKGANQRLGGHHAAKILLYSIDFDELATLQHADRWDEATALIVDAGKRLERGGADCVLICANTMHISAPELERAVKVPLLHIADVTGAAIVNSGAKRVGFLGTAFTMEKPFYTDRLREKFGLDVLIPEQADRAATHRIIFDELVRGTVSQQSKQAFHEIIQRLIDRGAEAVILGCTELMMIIGAQDSAVPLFDTTTLHCEAALDFALGSQQRFHVSGVRHLERRT
jgi:aspartate racemase